MKNKTVLATFTVILSAMFWGTFGIFAKSLYALGLTPLQLTAIRSFFTALSYLIAILIYKPKLLKIKLKDIPLFICTGILTFLLFNVFYMFSMSMNSISVAVILLYTSPVWVTLISAIFMHDKLNAKKIIALVLAVGGCAAVSFGGDAKVSPLGIVCGVLSGIGYGVYSIASSAALKKYHVLTTSFYTFALASIAILPFANIQSLLPLASSADFWLNTAGLVMLATVIPFGLYSYGLIYLPTATASMLSILEPVMALIFDCILFEAKIQPIGYIGIFSIIFALILLETSALKHHRAKHAAKSKQ